MTESKIVLNPINIKNKNPPYKEDYIAEMKNFKNKTILSPCWKDSIHNKARVGDKFAFIVEHTDMYVFNIISILNPYYGNPKWKIDEEKKRNVLVLSKLLFMDNWEDYKERTGKFGNMVCPQGTIRSDWIPPFKECLADE